MHIPMDERLDGVRYVQWPKGKEESPSCHVVHRYNLVHPPPHASISIQHYLLYFALYICVYTLHG